MFLKIRGSYMGTEEDNCARSCSIRRIAQTPLQEQRIAARRWKERHPSTRQQVPNLEVLVVSQNYLKTLDQLSALDMCAPIGNCLKRNERCRICMLAFFAVSVACEHIFGIVFECIHVLILLLLIRLAASEKRPLLELLFARCKMPDRFSKPVR